MDGDAAARDAHVLAPEARGPAQLHPVAVREERPVAEALAEGRVGREGARGAVDVELGVAAGVAPVDRPHVDELLAGLVDGRGKLLQHRGALREGHPPQGWPPDRAGVLDGGSHVDARRAGPRDDLAGGRVLEGGAFALAFLPLAGRVAGEDLHG